MLRSFRLYLLVADLLSLLRRVGLVSLRQERKLFVSSAKREVGRRDHSPVILSGEDEIARLATSISKDPRFKGDALDAYAAAQTAFVDFSRRDTQPVPVVRPDS